jgi:hypothetical protein
MRSMRAGFATLMVLCFGLSAEAREGNPVIGSQSAHMAEGPNDSLSGQNEIAENLPDCRKVDVDIDEGYGVSGHATRDECAPRRR